MQRLFWSFAGGWPGIGLLIQRMTTAALLLHSAAILFAKTFQSIEVAPTVIGAAAGILLLFGLWTPIAGILIAVVELTNIFLHATSPEIALTIAVLAATLAMIGPGAWSVDALLFGRKHIPTA